MTDPSTLSEKELKALTYFVIGVSSESNIGGRDASNRLSFAGTYRDKKMYPVENSGLSIGTLQKDLGQDKHAGVTATTLVDAYQAWARANHPDMTLSDTQRTQAINDLSRSGKTIKQQHNRALDAAIKSRLDSFLQSEGGKDFVHQLDQAQVEHIHAKALTRLTQTLAYQHASINDQIKLATIVAKAFNQSQVKGGGLLKAMTPTETDAPSVNSLNDVQAYAAQNFTPAMLNGRDDALRGAEIYTQLRHASPQNPLHDAWQEILNDPLIKPTVVGQDATHPHLAAQYTTIKNLFLEPAKSKQFIHALEQGSDYSQGLQQAVGNRHATSGFFVSGTDFVQWNAEGNGYAHIAGEWSEITRDAITQVRQADTSVDLIIHRDGTPEPLLHVASTSSTITPATGATALHPGLRGDDVNALQSQLVQLGYTDNHGRVLQVDGHYGPSTEAAVRTFQSDHGLSADGIAGKHTLQAIQGQRALLGTVPAFAPELDGLRPAQQAGSAVSREAASADIPAPSTATNQPPSIPEHLLDSTVPPMAPPDIDASAISRLQQHLATLGMTDHRGQPLPVTGAYDDHTRFAVTMFQKDQGLPGNGLPDPGTCALIEARATIAELQHVERERPAPLHEASWREGTKMLSSPSATAEVTAHPGDVMRPQRVHLLAASEQGIDDPRNAIDPNHALYNELKTRIPEASENRLLQFTAACHSHRITAENLGQIYFDRQDGRMTFTTSWPPGPPAIVDLKIPSPEPQQSIQHIQQCDQQQVQMMSEIRAQNAQIEAQAQQGPVLGGPQGPMR